MSISFKGNEKIWFDGKIVDFKDATIHALSHCIHYGTSIFEGGRCYATPKGPAVFRLKDHSKRMFQGLKVYRMDTGPSGIKFTEDDISKATLEVIKVNGFKSCYIRPIAFRGYGALGVSPFDSPVQAMVAVCELGDYLAGASDGVKVQVATWQRMAPNTFPAMVKSGANYMNSQLIKMEALLNGLAEGIALDVHGLVSEGSGENIFIVRDGTIYTPPLGNSILGGITRDSIINLAKDAKIPLIERPIPREELYFADEVFFTGSAAEISPIIEIDKIIIGKGKPGEITKRLKKDFFDIIECKAEDRHNWLTFVK